MTDFEDRLTTALRSAGGDAPDGAGLAPAVRRRAGARRRRTALTSAAAVVAVVAVVGGAALWGQHDSGRPPVADDAAPSPTVRFESWRDLQVTVPASWGYGALSTWCTDGATEPGTPVVERSGGVRDLILCTGPANGYGVQFFDGALADLAYSAGHVWKYEKGDAEAAYPEGAWLGYQRGGDSGDNIVWVVGPDRATTEEILASVERITGVDANGCAPHPADQAPAVADGDLRLCRYGTDDWLEQSEVLSGQDAADAEAALASAPMSPDRFCAAVLTGPVVLVSGPEGEGRVTTNACQGLMWAGTRHDLTADVLYWVLSPGWTGALDGDVPMPDRLRS